MSFRSAWIAVTMVSVAMGVGAQELVLSNPLDVDRGQEVVEVPLAQVLGRLHLTAAQASSVLVLDFDGGSRIPDQVYASRPGGAPDTLLLLVDMCAHCKLRATLKVDAEAALRRSNAKFRARFAAMEKAVGGAAGLEATSAEGLEKLWATVKATEGKIG